MIPKTDIICEKSVVPVKDADVQLTLERPIFDSDTTPVIIAPGWIEGQATLEPLRHEFAMLGRPAVTLEHSHSFDTTMFNPGPARAESIRAVMKKLHNEYGYEQFDITGHSLGGVDAIRLAESDGEMVRSVTLLASAGLIQDDTVINIIGRLNIAAMHELGNFIKHPATYQKVAIDSLFQFCRNPARGLVEAMSAGNIDIRDSIRKLGGYGLRIACVQFAKDYIFEVERVNQSIKDTPFSSNTIHENQHAGHNAPSLYPHEVAEHVEQILYSNSLSYALAS